MEARRALTALPIAHSLLLILFPSLPCSLWLSCSCPPQHRLAEHVDLTDLLGVPRLMNFGVCMQKSQSRMSELVKFFFEYV